MKSVLQTLGGVLALLIGLASMYLFLINLALGFNFLFFTITLIAIGVSIFLFILVNKQPPVTDQNSIQISNESAEAAQSRLARNNEMLGEWKKTNETKDRLRMLQMQASADSTES